MTPEQTTTWAGLVADASLSQDGRIDRAIFAADAELKRSHAECDAITDMNHAQWLALENCKTLASRHRKEEWAQHILRFCADVGVTHNPLRATGADAELNRLRKEVEQLKPPARGVLVPSDKLAEMQTELKRLRGDLEAEKLFSSQALKQRDALLSALKSMVKTEPCDCGCPQGQKTVVLKPAHYIAIARDAINKVEGAA